MFNIFIFLVCMLIGFIFTVTGIVEVTSVIRINNLAVVSDKGLVVFLGSFWAALMLTAAAVFFLSANYLYGII